MGVVQVFKCDRCEKIILPKEGIIVQGNVYVTGKSVDERPGVIGNNFAKELKVFDKDSKTKKDKDCFTVNNENIQDFIESHVSEIVSCRECMETYLKLGEFNPDLDEE